MTALENGPATITRPAAPRVPAARLRRWIRRRRAAAGEGLSPGTLYLVGLTVLMAAALVGPGLIHVAWPDVPVTGTDATETVALLAMGQLGILGALRRIGPLVVGRAELSWLFTTPVSRQGLLLPALVRVLILGGTAGAALGLVAAGRLLARPVAVPQLLGYLGTGAALGLVLGCAAVWGQRHRRIGRVLDILLLVLLPLLAAPALAERWPGAHLYGALPGGADATGWPGAPVTAAVTLAVAVAVIAATLRLLETFTIRHLHGPSVTVGSYLDAAYAAEPSYLADQRELRYWRGRRLNSVPVRGMAGLPLLVASDLLVLRRSGPRLGWLVAVALLPALLIGGPTWLALIVILTGAVTAAGTTMSGLRRDAEEPALIRLLGLTGHQAVTARLVLSTMVASGWSGLALGLLPLSGALPPGPWWALGTALGPLAALTAVRRARAGALNNALPLVDTPMGTFAPGPVIWLSAGLDLLVPLALPTVTALLAGTELAALTWPRVLLQLGLSGAAVLTYLALYTERQRSEL